MRTFFERHRQVLSQNTEEHGIYGSPVSHHRPSRESRRRLNEQSRPLVNPVLVRCYGDLRTFITHVRVRFLSGTRPSHPLSHTPFAVRSTCVCEYTHLVCMSGPIRGARWPPRPASAHIHTVTVSVHSHTFVPGVCVHNGRGGAGRAEGRYMCVVCGLR